MAEDVSRALAGLISGSKVLDSSPNIRHGKYRFLIRRIFAQLIENDKGKHRWAFWEFTVLESAPNPQVEGDHEDYPGTSGPLKDDGTKPNPVGSRCALKVDFDGPAARAAGSNIKSAILALFNKRDGEIADSIVDATWIDLSREKDLKVGDFVGIDPTTQQPIFVKDPKDEKKANPACGMVIDCETVAKKKSKANEKGAWINKPIWKCAAPMGAGVNAKELVAQRAAEVQLDQDDEEESTTSASPPAQAPSAMSIAAAMTAAQTTAHTAPTVVTPPAPPAAPPAPPSAPFPPAPWEAHTTAPGWFWSNPTKGGTNAVVSEAQLRASLQPAN